MKGGRITVEENMGGTRRREKGMEENKVASVRGLWVKWKMEGERLEGKERNVEWRGSRGVRK